jgi:DNA invertase Pin-like site-specific DNA recombinase
MASLQRGFFLPSAPTLNHRRGHGDLQDIVRTVKARGAALKATEQPIDTTTAAGKCFLDMLGVFAEFETNLRRERSLRALRRPKPLASTWGANRALTPLRSRASSPKG